MFRYSIRSAVDPGEGERATVQAEAGRELEEVNKQVRLSARNFLAGARMKEEPGEWNE